MSQTPQNRSDKKQFSAENCILHRTANCYGVPLNFTDKCECCQRYSNKQSLSCNFSINQLSYCGPQMASYMVTLQILSLFLFLLLLTYGLPLSIVNYLGNSCNSLNCSKSIFLTLSVFNSSDNLKNLVLNSYLLIACYSIFILFSLCIRFKLRGIKRKANETKYFPTDFGVFCKLPTNHINENEIAGDIQNWWKKELKSNKQVMIRKFPQLYQRQKYSDDRASQLQQDSSTIKTNPEIRNSRIIQKILFSYNYPDFCSMKKEIQALVEEFISQSAIKDQQDVQRLLKMYERKKKILQEIEINACCLVIFKLQQYAKYFHSKTSPNFIQQIICFENYRNLQIQSIPIQTIMGIFPTEIYWNNHHLTTFQMFTNQIIGWIAYFLLLIIGSGLIFLSSYLLKNTISSDTVTAYYFLIVATFINIFIVLSNKIILLIHRGQNYHFYAEQKYIFIIKTVFFQFILFVVAPLLSYKLTNLELLAANSNFLQISVTSILIFMCFTHISKYLSSQSISVFYFWIKMPDVENCSQNQANQRITKPNLQIQQQYSSVILIVSASFFLAPFSPYLLLYSFMWMLFQFILERINIAYFNRQDTFHGTLLNDYMISLLQKSPLLLVLGNVTAVFLSNDNEDSSLFQTTLIINSILFVFLSLSFILPYESINEWIFSQCQKEEEQNQIKLNYRQIKSNFLILYEQFNEAYAYGMKGKSQPLSTRAKIYEEMNTMSKTLTLSLKERLMNNQSPIYNNLARIIQPQSVQINNLYFEYEKKVHMNKPKSKVQIPPLFQKQPEIPQQQMIDFYNVFSGSDSEAKRILKQNIKNKLAKDFINERPLK